MESHLKHMKELTDKLVAIDAPITEEDQVVTLLGSLPQSYSTLVTALEARVDDIKLDFVQQALIHEELKLKGQNNSEEQGDSALIGKFKKTVKPQNLRCYCSIPYAYFVPYAYGTYHMRIRVRYNHTRMVRKIVPSEYS